MVAPSNSSVGLTRPAPSQLPGQFEDLYPNGVRNYVRVYPADDAEAAALALFARSRGVRSVFVLRDVDGGARALDLAELFTGQRRKLGIAIAGSRTWTARASDYARSRGVDPALPCGCRAPRR